jgi:hypothetical protein
MPECALWNTWPIKVKPQDDELLSSWLIRLAMAHGLKLQTFCHAVWPDLPIWNRDIDKCAENGLLSDLARLTTTPQEIVRQTTLRAYEGLLYEHHNPFGTTPWIMPIGVYHRTRRCFGQQFCPKCLASHPFLKKQWRLAFVTLCTEHGVFLEDRCPRCGIPLHFHRSEMGDRNRPPNPKHLTRCSSCHRDLARMRSRPAPTDGLLTQKWLLETMAQGYAVIPHHGPVYSHLLFEGLQILIYLCSGRWRHGHHRCLQDAGVTEEPNSTFETRSIEDRFKLVSTATHIVQQWPDAFDAAAEEQHQLSAYLLSKRGTAPYWLWKRVRDRHFLVYAPWKHVWSPDSATRWASYNKLFQALTFRKSSAYRRRQARVRFVASHPELWANTDQLCKALSSEKLYATTVFWSSIRRAVPGLLAAAQSSCVGKTALKKKKGKGIRMIYRLF